jgi:zinc transport system substrate-binding protein
MSKTQLISIVMLLIASPVVAETPSVVVTIKPIHSLVSKIMQGVGEPYLLLKGGQSAHNLTLKPSQAKEIHQADLLIWIGPIFENYLSKVVKENGLSSLSLMSVEGVALLPVRGGHAGDAEMDGHVWQNPVNAIGIVRAIVDRLNKLDPKNGYLYKSNGDELVKKLVILDGALEDLLKPVRGIPYLVYHDALQYFEQRYQLYGYAVTQHSEQQLSVKRIIKIQKLIAENKINCLFYESSSQPKLLTMLRDDGVIEGHAIDPMGVKLTVNPDGYFLILERMAQLIKACLNGRT